MDIRAIVVRGDEDARRAGGTLRLHPLSVLKASEKAASGRAQHAVRYGAATMFFMDDRSFPEPNGFWVGGARDSSVAFQPDSPLATTRLLVRNAPVENRLDVQAGEWRTSLALAAGEERHMDVPLDTARGATAITFRVASGFRPSQASPQSRDERFLGVWVQPQ